MKQRLRSCLLVSQLAIDFGRETKDVFAESEEYRLKYLLLGLVFLLSTHWIVAATSPRSLVR